MDMTVYKGDLYVIGDFDSIGGIAADKIARFDGANWHSLPIYLADYINTDTYTLREFKNELYIAAVTSDTIPQPLRNEYITKWDGATWSVLQDSSIYRACPVFCDGIYDMTVHDSLLYVVGEIAGTPSSPNFHGLGTWDGNNWVVAVDTGQFLGIGIPWDIEANKDGVWIETAGIIWHWDGIQFINTNHPGASKRSLIAGENFIYNNPYIDNGNGWVPKLLKGPWNDHMFAGDHLFFTRSGVLYKMDTSSFNVTTVDSLVPTLGLTAYQMTFYDGKLILGLTFGLDTNGSFLYSIDSAQVVSGLEVTELINTKVFPNPSHNRLIIQSLQNLNLIEIKDLTGTVILNRKINSNEFEIDTSELPNGLYLITTYSKSGIRQTQKVIIQH